jgi:cytochrome P450 family 4
MTIHTRVSVEKWKRHKKVISSTFSMPILNNFVKVFSAHSLKLVERLEEFAGKDKFDVFPFMNKSAVEITCETAMGKNINENSKNFDYGQCLTKAMTLVFTRLFQLWMYPSFIWNLTSHSVILKKLSKDLHDFVAKIVSDKQIEYRLHQDEYCEESVKRKCFLDHLIELSETSEHWPDHELMEEAQTMVAAGSESMGSTLSFVLMMVGMHPEVQVKNSVQFRVKASVPCVISGKGVRRDRQCVRTE